MIVDLRSDTLTKPTAAMKEAMFSAEVGDDVFNEDPSVLALQEEAAAYFGMEAGLYCPSGTMTNQIAIRVQTQPQEEVICDKYAHIYLYEGGGAAYNSFVSLRLLDGDRGRITAAQVAENINNPLDIHLPQTSLVALENTMNKGGGACYQFSEIEKIKKVVDRHGLKLHLDGARVFNALVKTKDDPTKYGTLFDTISVCFSKGLGAPVGSVLLGSHETIQRARRIRKVFGGGMRQAGFIAAACRYALENHVERLSEDHRRAQELGKIVEKWAYVEEVFPVETNIVIARLHAHLSPKEAVEKLAAKGIKIVPFGKQEIRFVTHLDITDDMIDYVAQVINK